jgi:hypothetical protein
VNDQIGKYEEQRDLMNFVGGKKNSFSRVTWKTKEKMEG